MQTAAQGSAAWIWWIMLAFAFVVIFLPARSQKKREQELQTKVNALQKGDQIILANGIIGTVVGFKDNALEVKVAESVKLTVLKNAVVGFLNDRTANATTEQGGKK
jgi:preprotein translocase subunit YajC